MQRPDRDRRESDLVTYYDNESTSRRDRPLSAERLRARTSYVERLAREGRTRLLEIGCGPGRDGHAFAGAGLSYTGVDLSPGAVAVARDAGLDGHVGSVLDLPFEDATFEAAWTMSTLLHVAPEDGDRALAETVRVLQPGSPLAVGLWGGDRDDEHWFDEGRGFGPARYFVWRADETLRDLLGRHGTVEEWRTWVEDGVDGRYQWAVLRTPQ